MISKIEKYVFEKPSNALLTILFGTFFAKEAGYLLFSLLAVLKY